MAETSIPHSPRVSEFGDLTKGTIRRRTRAIVATLLSNIMRLLFGYRVKGLENLPESGPFILISNHIANADPVLTQIGLKRNCHFFVKKEAFEIPITGRFAAWTGG